MSAAPSTGARRGGGVRYSTIVLLVGADQLLLPMFHIGPIPFKPSFLLLGIAAVDRLFTRRTSLEECVAARASASFALAVSGIIASALLGEAVLALTHVVPSYAETTRSILIYALWVLAFSAGLRGWQLNLRSLIWVLYVAIALNAAFSLLRGSLPQWLVDFYYTSADVQNLSSNGVKDISDILDMLRPRGLFLNPNVSMQMVNVIVLFLTVSMRRRFLEVPSMTTMAGVILLPIALAAILASRAEFLVALFYGLLNLRQVIRSSSRTRVAQLVAVSTILFAGVAIKVSSLLKDSSVAYGVERIGSLALAASSSGGAAGTDADQLSSVTRPLLLARTAADRFAVSPIFGSGFSSASGYPFDFETEYFHNDLFHLAVTSGLVGVGLLLWIIARFCWPIDWIMVVPFVLPGLTNTFLLNIPATVFYFMMAGVLLQKGRALPTWARLDLRYKPRQWRAAVAADVN